MLVNGWLTSHKYLTLPTTVYPPVSAVVLAVADLLPLEALPAAALLQPFAVRGLRPPLVVVPLAVALEAAREADVALAQRAEPLARVVVERAAREVPSVLRRKTSE